MKLREGRRGEERAEGRRGEGRAEVRMGEGVSYSRYKKITRNE